MRKCGHRGLRLFGTLADDICSSGDWVYEDEFLRSRVQANKLLGLKMKVEGNMLEPAVTIGYPDRFDILGYTVDSWGAAIEEGKLLRGLLQPERSVRADRLD